jgi:glycosyltransferase involved in cell wall biosynthesis
MRMTGASSGAAPVRVIHVVGTADGAPWMHEQVRELRARGYEATGVIAAASGKLARRFERDGIAYEVLDLETLSTSGTFSAAKKVFSLARLFRRLRPDVVQSHLFQSIIVTRLAAWLADVPVRFSMIPGPYYLEAPGLREVDARSAWLDTKVIASCERTRELYEELGVSRDRVELIYYGQDVSRLDPSRADGARVRRELGIDPDRPVVGDVAYFYAPQTSKFTPTNLVGRGVKGHDVLLRAVPMVLAEVPDALFLLVGEGWGSRGAAYQRQLEALAAELGVAHAVRFTGARDDIRDTLAAFDVSVQCSLSENLGGSIESQLMARPFIASAVGGLVDAVIHERTGLLVPPDDPSSLARAIVRLLRDRPFAQRLASEGRKHALALFTLTKAADDLDALYKRELGRLRSTSVRGYGLLRSAWRALYLAAWGWRLIEPLRRIAAGREPNQPIAPAREAPVRERATSDVSRDRAPDVSAEARSTARRPPRIVQMAGIVENGDWLVSICRDLRAKGGDVLAVIGAPEGTVARQLREAGISYFSIPLSFAPGSGRIGRLFVYAVRFPWAVLRLAVFFRRERVDVVHTHVFNTIMSGRIAAWLARVPFRVSMIPGPIHLETPFTLWADRLTWWMDHHVIAGSEWTRDRYRELGMTEPRLACVSYGADNERFDLARTDPDRLRRELGIAPSVPLIGLVAYFYPPRDDWQTPPAIRGRGLKGHDDFISAARLILQQRPEARFVLAGAGWGVAGEHYRQRLIARCREERLDEAVFFLGRRDDIPDILSALDVAVQCSLCENYGGTVEALMMERPTVATRVGGMPETIRHRETGLLVPPRDPEALAAAILELLDDRPRALAMARAGRALMLDRFRISGTADGIAALYDRHFASKSALYRDQTALDLGGNADRDDAVRDVVRHDRARADDGVGADVAGGHHAGAEADQ